MEVIVRALPPEEGRERLRNFHTMLQKKKDTHCMSLAQTDAFTEFGDHCTHGDRRDPDAGAALQHNALLEPSEAVAVGRPSELRTDALERCSKIHDFATELVEDTLAKDCLLLSRTVVLICPL